MSRIIKSKLYKPFIGFLVAIILVFSFEVNKPKAIVPIVIWGAGILAGVIAEEMLEMGIKHVTGDGKTSKKGKAGKIADEILDSLDGFDFDNTKPTRKADGSLEVNLSANDRAKIARKIADEFGDIVDTDNERDTTSTPKYSVDAPSTDPMYLTSVNINYFQDSDPVYVKGNDMAKKMFNVIFTPMPFEKRTKVVWRSVVDGTESTPIYVNGGTPTAPGNYTAYHWFQSTYFRIWNTSAGTHLQIPSTSPTYVAYNGYLKAMEVAGSKIHYAGGIGVPSTIKKVYPIGDGYNGDGLPNGQALSNKPYKIPNFFPPSSSDEDVEWELVQNHYDNDVTTNQTKIDNEYEYYLENGDLNKNTYTTQTINNYYTDTNYPVKSDDANLIVNIDIDIPPPVVIEDDDDGTGTVPDGESAPVIDRTLITYAKQTYDYLGDSIDGAITSMRDITDDASGLVDYLDTSFRWLPAEWRALFGSAFILGVFAHFMRR